MNQDDMNRIASAINNINDAGSRRAIIATLRAEFIEHYWITDNTDRLRGSTISLNDSRASRRFG